jgi:uncharacterized coiled-coil protein SlyX
MKLTLVALLSLSLLPSLAAQNGTPAAPPDETPSARVTRTSPQEKQLEEIRAQLAEQQRVIRLQQEQIEKLQKQLQQSSASIEEQSRQLQSAIDQLHEKTADSQQNTETALAAIKANDAETTKQVETSGEKIKALESPTALHFKGITLTPGGFLTADTLYRSRNENADASSSFSGIPYGGTANANLSEFRETSRVSRLSLLGEGKAGSLKLSSYFEIDFMAQAPTANQVETNAFSPRIRQGWLQAEMANGWTFSAGQFWSLITTDRKGIALRGEFIPNVMEASYIIGYDYVRQTALRITKKSASGEWTSAFEVANPETTYKASYIPGGTNSAGQPVNIFGLNNSTNATSPTGSTIGYLSGSSNGFSTNLMPDLLGKVSYDPKWGHYEVKALLRVFRDRTDPTGAATGTGLPTTAQTNVSTGFGLGFGAILPVVAKKVDFIVEGLGGAGIGRYGAGQSPDVTLRPDGALVPLHEYHMLAGFEFHPTPKLDIFTFGGDEYTKRASYVNPLTGGAAGYGSPLVTAAVAKAATTEVGYSDGLFNKNLWETTLGFWYRFYKGPVGTLQYGLQYEFLTRSTWSTLGGAPKGRVNVAFASFRYILP